MISYFYPPFSSVGATRVSKMTKYLADAGWQAHVLTVDRCDLPGTLPIEIPEDAITRAPQLFDLASIPRTLVGRRRLANDRVMPTQPRRWALLWRAGEVYRHLVCFPDGQIGWWRGAVARGLALAREIRPDVILSSSLPNTSHLVARAIARKTGIPWVAELRDLWTGNHNFRRVQPLRALEQRIERSVLSEAAALVTVSEVWAEELRAQHGRPTFVVPNGFDPSDYPTGAPAPSSVFTLVYTGMFYNGKQNPNPLFQAVRHLAASGRIRPEQFQMRFVGQYLGPILTRAEAYGIGAFVTAHPPVAYKESLRIQHGSTALLFLDWADGATKGWYSAKIYEYLGARRPILSVGPPSSVVGGLLGRTGTGVAAETPAQLQAVLEGWLREHEATGVLACHGDPAVTVQFNRQAAAAQMAEILNQYARR